MLLCDGFDPLIDECCAYNCGKVDAEEQILLCDCFDM